MSVLQIVLQYNLISFHICSPSAKQQIQKNKTNNNNNKKKIFCGSFSVTFLLCYVFEFEKLYLSLVLILQKCVSVVDLVGCRLVAGYTGRCDSSSRTLILQVSAAIACYHQGVIMLDSKHSNNPRQTCSTCRVQ